MAKSELTYAKAFARLQEIVAEIEQGDIDIDELAASVKEATRLVAFCRARLTATQTEVTQALKDAEAAAQPASDAAATLASEPAAAPRRAARPARPAPAPAPTPPAQAAEDPDFDPFADD